MDSGVFSYVKINLHVQRNKLLSETKANNVEKSNLITNVETLVDRLNIVQIFRSEDGIKNNNNNNNNNNFHTNEESRVKVNERK